MSSFPRLAEGDFEEIAMKIGKWYSSQDSTVKGAIIAAVATIAAAVVGFAAVVLVPLITAKGDSSDQASPQASQSHSLVRPLAINSSSSSSPKQSGSPTLSPSHQAAARAVPATQAAVQSPAPPTPTATPPGPKSISGTYTFTRQLITCTFSSCGTNPIYITFTCPAAGSCMAYWSYWGSHAATFDGTKIDISFTGTGSINCKGTALPTAVTLDINVLSWTSGQGGATRTPTRMQGTYTESAPASDAGCKAAGTQQTVSYG
jgi:hypothetical protein